MPVVAIIGAGPAGCAAAIHLARRRVPVAIFTKPQSSPIHRVPETLPPGIYGKSTWPIPSLTLRPLYSMVSAWGSSDLTIRHSICNPMGNGWFVDRQDFDSELLRTAMNAGVSVSYDRLISVSKTATRWVLDFAGGKTIAAEFVMDASGRAGAFARRIGVRRKLAARLVCLSARATPDGFPSGEALLESAEKGWWFSALNNNGELNLSFYTRPGSVVFEQALHATVHTVARAARLIDSVAVSRPANTDWLENPAGERWLAIGDAAFASDPLAAQGLARALEWAENAARLFIKSEDFKDAAEEHSETCVECIRRFLSQRQVFYNSERRWPESPFWRSALLEI